MTVRSATSLRISWIARRVSASMSRRVCSSISSRASFEDSLASRSWTSAAFFARDTISSACARASVSRSRYSASSCSASCLVRSAVSIDSSIARWRLSRASAIRGNARRASTTMAATNTTSVQIIRPTPGLTRKLPPLSEEAAVTVTVAMDESIGSRLEEEGQQAGHEAVEHAGLGEREAQPLDRGDLVAHLRLTGDRLDHLAEDVADADAGARGTQAAADAECDGLAGLRAGVGRLGEVGDDSEVHSDSLVSAPRRRRRRGRSR